MINVYRIAKGYNALIDIDTVTLYAITHEDEMVLGNFTEVNDDVATGISLMLKDHKCDLSKHLFLITEHPEIFEGYSLKASFEILIYKTFETRKLKLIGLENIRKYIQDHPDVLNLSVIKEK